MHESGIDIERVRADTPGCDGRIHFNNAGAALPPRPVVDAMVEYLRLEERIGGYEAADRCAVQLERPYHAVAELIGAAREEVSLHESATRAWQMALYSIPLAPGDRILTTSWEYPGNYVGLLHRARQTGATVHLVEEDESGGVSLDALKRAIDDRTRLIALTHVPTNNGLVNPAEEVGRIAREAGVLYLLDGAQSAGQIPLDVRQTGCDMLVATGRKYLRGPRGTGFLYVREEAISCLDPPLLDWAAARFAAVDRFEVMGDSRRFETWEASMAGRVGLGVAVDYALETGLYSIQERVVKLANRLRSRLAEVEGITVTDTGRERCGIVTFRHESVPPDAICRRLSERNINVYPRAVTPLDVAVGRAEPVVRASVHYYNNEDEVDIVCRELATICHGRQ